MGCGIPIAYSVRIANPPDGGVSGRDQALSTDTRMLASSSGMTEHEQDLNALGLFVQRVFRVFDNVRLSTVGSISFGLTIFVLVVGVLATTVTLTKVSTIATTWRDFDTGLGRRFDLFAELRGRLGYGGLAQHWGAWQAGDDSARVLIAQDILAIRSIQPAWMGAHPGAEEAQALNQVISSLDSIDRAAATNSKAVALSNAQLQDSLNKIALLLRQERTAGGEKVEDAMWGLGVTVSGVMTLSALLLVFLMLFYLWFSRIRVARPIHAAASVMQRLAQGDTNVHVPFTEKVDEMGEMARTVEVFRANAIERNRLQAQRIEDEKRSHEERRAEMLAMANELEGRIQGVVSVIRQSATKLHESATTLSANAEQAQRQSCAVAAATEQATSNVETVSAAGTELSASIAEISVQVTEAARVAHSASIEAHEANRRISGLSDAAQKIGEVVALINAIASQTNLLALNATIESARAGEAGKGFAVVAHEVKGLAGQTSNATGDIASQIATIQTQTHEAVDAIQSITATIQRINEMSTHIAGAVEEQGAATAEIARNVEQATGGTRQVAENISMVAEASAETGRMAHEVFDAAAELQREIGDLEQSVQEFLSELRSK